ncbi:MAG TPA: hypothetical protein VGY32_08940 [Solirubrobacteraceae bacterium]|nr:hypothetical protein [Solirubrobacteraceae bacterium]
MSRRRALLFDFGVAVLAAVLVVVLSPGLALVGVIALVAFILILLSLFFGWAWGRLRPGHRDPVEQVRRLRRSEEVQPVRRRPAQTSRRRPPRAPR